MGKIHLILFKFGPVAQKKLFIDFLQFLALVDILFGGAESFVQFWYRILWGTFI